MLVPQLSKYTIRYRHRDTGFKYEKEFDNKDDAEKWLIDSFDNETFEIFSVYSFIDYSIEGLS